MRVRVRRCAGFDVGLLASSIEQADTADRNQRQGLAEWRPSSHIILGVQGQTALTFHAKPLLSQFESMQQQK